MYVFIYKYVSIYVFMCLCMYVCMYTRMYVFVHAMYVRIPLLTCRNLGMYVCVCIQLLSCD
jgi:hypothetical protein